MMMRIGVGMYFGMSLKAVMEVALASRKRCGTNTCVLVEFLRVSCVHWGVFIPSKRMFLQPTDIFTEL